MTEQTEQAEPIDAELLAKLLIEVNKIQSGEIAPPKRQWTNEDLAEQIADLDRRMMKIQIAIDELARLIRTRILNTP